MEIHDVETGHVMVVNGTGRLKSTAIGSCVVVVAYDAVRKVGGMAHVMLPGRAPSKCDNSGAMKYTANAIDEMLSGMIQLGARRDDIRAAIVGGANVLQREDDTICLNNITSVTTHLTSSGICIDKKILGGIDRRSVSLDVKGGLVHCTEGDNSSVSYSLAGQRGEEKIETER